MHRDSQLGLEKFSGLGSVLNIHGIVAADGQKRYIQFISFADQLHVQKEPGVTGVVDIFLAQRDYIAAGVAGVLN